MKYLRGMELANLLSLAALVSGVRIEDGIGQLQAAKQDREPMPLHTAAFFGDVKAAERALAAGADKDELGNNRWTPLHFAASGSPEVVKLLLAHGADKDKLDYTGKTPLDLAKARIFETSHREVVTLLKAAGAKTGEEVKAGSLGCCCHAKEVLVLLVSLACETREDEKAPMLQSRPLPPR
ncbi:unnamed protein product [Effrenium voratum]|uniref:Ankyrin repeat domain-containing protein n=1 Tax=Effrenium voratum TaxID=2562239 RepID=A0AA36IJ38_9DINO|nr:unnamed protein product [Effrenium voratum]